MSIYISEVRVIQTQSVRRCRNSSITIDENPMLSLRVLAHGFSGRGGETRSLLMYSFQSLEQRLEDWARLDVIKASDYVSAMYMVRALRESYPEVK